VESEVLGTSNDPSACVGDVADNVMFLCAIGQKLQNVQSWKFAWKCTLVQGWCPYIF